MISPRNILFIFFLLTCLDSMMSVYGKTKCEINILTDFQFTEEFPDFVRRDAPRRAFLRLTINSFTNDDAKSYFEHLYFFLHHKDNMLLPRDYCDDKTKSLRLYANPSREDEYQDCVTLLCTTFLDSEDKTDVLKSTFWEFTEDMFSKFGITDYRYKYFHYLSGKMVYPQSVDQLFPLTIREFCYTLHPDNNIDLMRRDKSELTKAEAVQYCITKIFNDFEITSLQIKHKSRTRIPKMAFLSYVEDDLESPDAKDYYYHIYSVIKAKVGTETPRQYCKTITEEIEEEKKIEEEEKCVVYLLSTYLDSDATTVVKDTFRNFRESHFSNLDIKDYRFRYFYYLSGSYDFYKIDMFRDSPLTPMEFCKMDRTEALILRILMESISISRGGTSSSTSRHT